MGEARRSGSGAPHELVVLDRFWEGLAQNQNEDGSSRFLRRADTFDDDRWKQLAGGLSSRTLTALLNGVPAKVPAAAVSVCRAFSRPLFDSENSYAEIDLISDLNVLLDVVV